MESFNQLYPTLDTSSLLESTLEDIYKKEEATNNQFISNLKSINEVKKLNERRNANINSRNNTMMNSITIPTLLDIDHNSNSNLLMNNMIQNQLLNPNISSINKISKLNNLNLYNQNSEKYNLQSRPLDITNNCCNLQSSNMLNSLNTYPNLNLKSIYSPVQMNESTTQMNQNACYLSTPPLLSLINNNQLFEKINLLNNDEIKTQIERLYLDKLIKDNQLLSNKEVKNKFENMIIPSVDSNENNLVNNNILIPSIETDLINNMIIPKSEPNESIVTNSNLLNSINIPFNLESNNEDQLSDNLLKQYQLQEQQLAMKINNNLSKKYVNDSKFENILTNIPTITINESNDLFKPSDISTQENNNGSSIDINTLLKPTMNIRQNAINNYTPLSPELSPLLNSDNIIIESNKTLENCVKKNEHIALSSRNTLNSILSITPEMEPINSPIIKNNISNFNSNQNELMGNFYDSFKPSECKINENPSDLLMMGNGLLNTPATPKSAIISPDLNSGDFTDISSINFDSFEVNSLFNNNSTNEKKCNDGEQQFSFENSDIEIKNILENLNLDINPLINNNCMDEIKNANNDEQQYYSITSDIEPIMPKNQEVSKSSNENIENLPNSIEDLLSSVICSGEKSESKIQTNDNSKKNCCEEDFKIIKQLNTLNYILVSYKQLCSALCKNKEDDIKASCDKDLESQYDIPMEETKDKLEKEYSNEESENEIKVDIEVENDIENKNECSEDEQSDNFEEEDESENEEKSLFVLKKEIQKLRSKSNKGNTKVFEEVIPIKSIETVDNGRKRKHEEDEDDSNNKTVHLSIKQIKNSLENGNRMSIGNELGVNSVSALTKNGLVLVGRKRIIAENTNRPYVCSTCGAGFTRKHDLNRHKKVHTGVKNYKCPYCDKGFSRNDALSRHLRVEIKHRSQENEMKKKRKLPKRKRTATKQN